MGRRPSQRKKLIRNISTIAPITPSLSHEVVEGHLLPNSPFTMTDVECLLCLGVLERPIQLSCGQLCCTACLCTWVKHTLTLDPLCCPCCPLSHTLLEKQLHPAPQVLVKLLDCYKYAVGDVGRVQPEYNISSIWRVAANIMCQTQQRTQVRFIASLSMSLQDDLLTL